MAKKHVKCWDSLEEKLKQLAEIRRPDCSGEARLAVGILISAGRDKDLVFFNSPEFERWCVVCKINVFTMKQLIKFTWDYIDKKRNADFDFDFDEMMGIY